MRWRGNAKLWQMPKKMTDFLWIRFFLLSDGRSQSTTPLLSRPGRDYIALQQPGSANRTGA
jgi:hypothetical protein